METVLVSGGAGFIGSHLCEKLLESNYSVVIFDDFSSGKRENLSLINDKIEIIDGSITDRAKLQEAMAGIDYVVNLAAIVSVAESINKPEKCYKINVEGTRNILSIATKNSIKKVVLASSAAVYGNALPPLKEEFDCRPLSPYGESKLMNELDAFKSYNESGLEVVCLRYFNVYGERQDNLSPYSGVITKFISALKNNKQPVIFGDGEQTRDFIYVKDVAKATHLAIKAKKAAGNAINIATGKAISLKELLSELKKLLNKDMQPRYADERKGDIRHSFADIAKARKLLNFEPSYDLERGLKETIESREYKNG